MILSYHSEVTDGRYKAQFRLFVQIVRNLSERKSQREFRKIMCLNKQGKGEAALRIQNTTICGERKGFFEDRRN